MSSRPLTLEELKMEAQKLSYLVIRRDREAAWYPLKTWSGHSSGVTYYLIGNKVLVKNGLGDRVCWYVLA